MHLRQSCILTIFALTVAMAPTHVRAQLSVAHLFSDGMVLQRDVAVPVWGRAGAGAEVVVTFAGVEYRGRADDGGGWKVALPARPAGGPYEMVIAAGGDRIRISDILVGDVWIASGQSNMEWTVTDSKDAELEISRANDRGIRHFKVPRSWSEWPADTLAGGAWATADPEHVGAFSAVGYYFARELRRRHDVAIGLINATWGGSRIEPWMSAVALGLDRTELEQARERERLEQQRVVERLRARIGELPEAGSILSGSVSLWAAPALDDSSWADLSVPGLWEGQGYDGLDGIAWYRTTFQLTEAEARSTVRLGLGMIDDSDITWLNGHRVGATEWAWNQERVYDVPAAHLRPGRNLLAIRVQDGGGGGGIHGAPDLLFVEVGGERRPFAGPWKFRVESLVSDGESRRNQIATLLYNQMIHPLRAYPIKGVLWYQGESNATAADAFRYRDLFARMITSWRFEWQVGDFPFLFVQLANYKASDAEAAESSWALLRESQSAALSLPNTAQVVTIDIGDPNDIHPRNKQEVGRRLALAARKIVFGEDLVYSGPVYRRHEIRNGRVIIEFEHVGGGLAVRDGESTLNGFALAGPDQRFVPAHATIEHNRVVVWSESVPKPAAVRYAWSDNPESANLYNRAGLPASPFRTDAW